MVVRNRTLSYGSRPGGFATATAPGVNDFAQPSVSNGQQTMTDTIGNRLGVNPLSSVLTNRNGGSLSGPVGFAYTVSDWKVDTVIGHLAARTIEPSDNSVRSAVLARSNPSRPVVDLPVFLWELKDIPHMIKEAGEAVMQGKRFFLSKRGGSRVTLSWEFGWKPLISDLVNLFNFSKLVDDRLAELKKMRDKGLRKNFTIWGDTNEATGWFYPCTVYSANMQWNYLHRTERKKWGSVEWHTTSSLPWNNSDDMRRLARQAVFGQGLQPQALWEALPWSWMVDWFSNIGDMVNATRNLIPAGASNQCVMTNTKSTITFTPRLIPPGCSYQFGTPTYEWKIRSVGDIVYPEFRLPIIDGRKASILAALSILRFTK